MPKQSKQIPDYCAEYLAVRAVEIGARVRSRRLELGLTQDVVRTRLELERVCISRSHYSRLENGTRLPNALELEALSTVLKVSLEWFLVSKIGETEK